MSLRVPAGLRVIVHPVEDAHAENVARQRADGKVFVPPWRVWVYGPRTKLPRNAQHIYVLHEDDNLAVGVYGVFTFNTKGLSPRFTTDKFPYAWAPRPLAESVTAWLETTGGLTADTEEGPDDE